MLTHVDEKGVKMVDVSKKDDVERTCVAKGCIKLKPSTIEAIEKKKVIKGDVLTTAQIAGIMAVKKTSELIPMCHPLPITSVNVDFEIFEDKIGVEVKVKTTYKTGIEMEALTGVSVALLTILDMVKAIEKDENGQYPETEIFGIKVLEKIKGEAVPKQ
ncbi:MAG: cyclic pyranopterin monophosphate synthase [Methanothermococcus sp.]|jgi:cyclic pyranopterin phosphate synthase|uniref:cyclic pyranopterin monophosphate synthase MoaC n=1 Tax=Methanothermococcus TaxID=155862 RepID=UPI00035D3185|nr:MULTISPECIES: cyclic pyranopterin monophosphate synthase MoaC [Methanothermococcus]MDK2789517.1 cyclic pyranopterin monophosphate synthase [Methanothermococcus sp.]MDK2987440.1 cyclic pyranopterin monophosphate synthase [Methanothermococcus sp.]